MMAPRKPSAFRLESSERRLPLEAAARSPQVIDDLDSVVVTPAEVDVFDEPEITTALPAIAGAPKRRSWLSTLLFASVGALFSLALGLWTDQLIRELFARADWLGWVASALAALVAISLVVFLGREFLALRRLATVETLRWRALKAFGQDDASAARTVVSDLSALFAANPQTAAGRRALASLQGDIIDGAALMRLAEAELLTSLDASAKLMILDAAKRVSLVTAVSPRALVDVAYVVFESVRLIRRLSELYGGRPGTLGFFRLTRNVLAHLAVTGSIAVGDSFVQQIVGHGLAARLSARLGEGVVNGMMTARIGLAALEAVRPMPFLASKRPSIGDFLSSLASFATSRNPRET